MDPLDAYPASRLASYYILKETKYASVYTLLYHLKDLREEFYTCYKGIEVLYGPRRGATSPSILKEYRLPVREQQRFQLHGLPEPYTKLYPQLLTAQSMVESEIKTIMLAVKRYESNLQILYQEFVAKASEKLEELGDEGFKLYNIMGEDVVEASFALEEMVGPHQMPDQAYHEKYLGEIARFWRTWCGKEDYGLFEHVWQWVAGRHLRWE